MGQWSQEADKSANIRAKNKFKQKKELEMKKKSKNKMKEEQNLQEERSLKVENFTDHDIHVTISTWGKRKPKKTLIPNDKSRSWYRTAEVKGHVMCIDKRWPKQYFVRSTSHIKIYPDRVEDHGEKINPLK